MGMMVTAESSSASASAIASGGGGSAIYSSSWSHCPHCSHPLHLQRQAHVAESLSEGDPSSDQLLHAGVCTHCWTALPSAATPTAASQSAAHLCNPAGGGSCEVCRFALLPAYQTSATTLERLPAPNSYLRSHIYKWHLTRSTATANSRPQLADADAGSGSGLAHQIQHALQSLNGCGSESSDRCPAPSRLPSVELSESTIRRHLQPYPAAAASTHSLRELLKQTSFISFTSTTSAPQHTHAIGQGLLQGTLAVPIRQRLPAPAEAHNLLIAQDAVTGSVSMDEDPMHDIVVKREQLLEEFSSLSYIPSRTISNLLPISSEARLMTDRSPTSSVATARVTSARLQVSERVAAVADLSVSALCHHSGALHLQTVIRQLLHVWFSSQLCKQQQLTDGLACAAVCFRYVVNKSHRESNRAASASASADYLSAAQLHQMVLLLAAQPQQITADHLEQYESWLLALPSHVQQLAMQLLPTLGDAKPVSVADATTLQELSTIGATKLERPEDRSDSHAIVKPAPVVDALRDSLLRYTSLLQLDAATTALAGVIGNQAVRFSLCTRRTSQSLSAAVVYLAIQLQNVRMTQFEFCRQTAITEVTLRKVYRELIDFDWRKLLPEGYKPVTVPSQLQKAALEYDERQRQQVQHPAQQPTALHPQHAHTSHQSPAGIQPFLRLLHRLTGEAHAQQYVNAIEWGSNVTVPLPSLTKASTAATPTTVLPLKVRAACTLSDSSRTAVLLPPYVVS